MPRVAAARELLAPREDVWAFLAEPRRLADWWPGLAAVEPDRRGFAAGARWTVHGDERPRWFRSPSPTGHLVVLTLEAPRSFRFLLTGESVEAELVLEATAPDRTRAQLTVEGPWLIGLSRRFPHKALAQLHALVQTAAPLD